MKISARNQIAGAIVSITPGAAIGSIKVDIGGSNRDGHQGQRRDDRQAG